MQNFLKRLAETPGVNLDQYTIQDFAELEAQLSILPLPNQDDENRTWNTMNKTGKQSKGTMDSSSPLSSPPFNMDGPSDDMVNETRDQSAQQSNKQDLRNVISVQLDQDLPCKALLDVSTALLSPQQKLGVIAKSNCQTKFDIQAKMRAISNANRSISQFNSPTTQGSASLRPDQFLNTETIIDSTSSPKGQEAYEQPRMISDAHPSSNGQIHTAAPNVLYKTQTTVCPPTTHVPKLPYKTFNASTTVLLDKQDIAQRGRGWSLPSGFRQPDILIKEALSDEDLITAGQEYVALLYRLDRAYSTEHTKRLRELRQLLGPETVKWLKSKGVGPQHIFEVDRTNWIDVYNVPSGIYYPPPLICTKEGLEKFDLIGRGYDNINDELSKEQENREALICEDTAVSIFGQDVFGYEKETHPGSWVLEDAFLERILFVSGDKFESLIDDFYAPVPIGTFDDSAPMDLNASDMINVPLTDEYREFPPPKRARVTARKEIAPQNLGAGNVISKPTPPENKTRFRLNTNAPTSSAEWSWGEPPAKKTRAPSQISRPRTDTFSDILNCANKDTKINKPPAKGKTASAPLKSTYRAAKVKDDDESGTQASSLTDTLGESKNRGATTFRSYPSQEPLRHKSGQIRYTPVDALPPGAPSHSSALSGPYVNNQAGFGRPVAGGVQAPTFDLQADLQGSMNHYTNRFQYQHPSQTFGGEQYSQYSYQPHQQWSPGYTLPLTGCPPNQCPTLQAPVSFNPGHSTSFPPRSANSRDSSSVKQRKHDQTFPDSSGANAEPIQPKKQRKSRPEPLVFAVVVPDRILSGSSPASNPAARENSFLPVHSINRHGQQGGQQSPDQSEPIPDHHRASSVSPNKKRGVRKGRGSPKKSISGPPGTPTRKQSDAAPNDTRPRATAEDMEQLDDTPIKLNLSKSSVPVKAGLREFAVIGFGDIAARVAGEKILENKIKKDPLYMVFKVVADLGMKRLNLKVSGPPGGNVRGQLKYLFPHNHIVVAMA